MISLFMKSEKNCIGDEYRRSKGTFSLSLLSFSFCSAISVLAGIVHFLVLHFIFGFCCLPFFPFLFLSFLPLASGCCCGVYVGICYCPGVFCCGSLFDRAILLVCADAFGFAGVLRFIFVARFVSI